MPKKVPIIECWIAAGGNPSAAGTPGAQHKWAVKLLETRLPVGNSVSAPPGAPEASRSAREGTRKCPLRIKDKRVFLHGEIVPLNCKGAEALEDVMAFLSQLIDHYGAWRS